MFPYTAFGDDNDGLIKAIYDLIWETNNEIYAENEFNMKESWFIIIIPPR